MRGIVTADSGFAFTTLPAPARPGADDVLIDIQWVSLNRGEPGFPWQRGEAIGWDAFGLVAQASADGQGPPPGARVATWSFAGAWAEQRVVSRHNLALVPDTVTGQQAAALPVAGLTALQAVEAAGAREGTLVGITGASGGVGHLATQLAVRAGARVVAFTRDPSRIIRLRPAVSDDGVKVLTAGQADRAGVLDAVIDNVGGASLPSLVAAVRPGGKIILVGNASGGRSLLDTGHLISRRIDLLSAKDPTPAGENLARLLSLIANGELRLSVAEGGDWSALVPHPPLSRQPPGKTVYRVM
jgi:NADPH:quinone reductase